MGGDLKKLCFGALVALALTLLSASGWATCRPYGGPDEVYGQIPSGSTLAANTIYWTFFNYDDHYPIPYQFYADLSGSAGGLVQLALYDDGGAAPYNLIALSAAQIAVPGRLTFTVQIESTHLWLPSNAFPFTPHLRPGNYAVALYVQSGSIGPKFGYAGPTTTGWTSPAICDNPFSDPMTPVLSASGSPYAIYSEGCAGGTLTPTKTVSATQTVCIACSPTFSPTISATSTATRTQVVACQISTATPTSPNSPTHTPTRTMTCTPTVTSTSTATASFTPAACANFQWGVFGAGNGNFKSPNGLRIDSAGNIFVADTLNHRIQKFDASGNYLFSWGSSGTGAGQFNAPLGTAVDGAGDVYVVDSGNNRIQKFDPSGAYITQWGSYGSGNGQFYNPTNAAVDFSGNVYVSDRDNYRIEKFDPNGVYLGQWGSLGTGDGQFGGTDSVAIDAAGYVYVSDSNRRIQKFDLSGAFITKWGSMGYANAQFLGQTCITFDALGDLYISDSGQNRIQKFTSSGTFLGLWGSFGTALGQLDWPRGIAMSSSGTIYISDSDDRVQAFVCSPALVTVTVTNTPTPSKTATVCACTLTDTPTRTPSPSSTATSTVTYSRTATPSATMTATVTQTFNVTATPTITPGCFGTQYWYYADVVGGTAWAGSAAPLMLPAEAAQALGVNDSPPSSTTNAGLLADGEQEWWETSSATTPAGPATYIVAQIEFRTLANGFSRSFALNYSNDGTVNSAGADQTFSFNPGNGGGIVTNIQTALILSPGSWDAAKVEALRLMLRNTSSAGTPADRETYISEIKVSVWSLGICTQSPTSTYSSSPTSTLTLTPSANPCFITAWGSAGSGSGQFNTAYGVATDAAGNVYVTDQAQRVQKFDLNGNFILQWGSAGSGNGQFSSPKGIVADAAGDVFVVDYANNRIQKFDPSGAYLGQWGSLGSGNGQFNSPYGIAVDAASNVYVSDRTNQRIQKFDSNGTYLSQWGSAGTGNGQFNIPNGVAVDASGNIFVVDSGNSRIEKFDPSGSYLGQWGSGGSADGQFNTPLDVVTDASGDVYVSDYFNGRIQRFNNAGAFVGKWGTPGSAPGQFANVGEMAMGALGRIYIVDVGNARVQVFGCLSGAGTSTATSTVTNSATASPTPTATPSTTISVTLTSTCAPGFAAPRAGNAGTVAWTGEAGPLMSAAEAAQASGVNDSPANSILNAGQMNGGEQAWWDIDNTPIQAGVIIGVAFTFRLAVPANGVAHQEAINYSYDGSTVGLLGTSQTFNNAANPGGGYLDWSDSINIPVPSGGWTLSQVNNLRFFIKNTSSAGVSADQVFWVKAVDVFVQIDSCGLTPTVTSTSGSSTSTSTVTRTPSATPSATATVSRTLTATPSAGSATATPTWSDTATCTLTSTRTVTPTFTRTATSTSTSTPIIVGGSFTSTSTATATVSSTLTATPSITAGGGTNTPPATVFPIPVVVDGGTRVYPSPARGNRTNIAFSARQSAQARIVILDARGRVVLTLNEAVPAGPNAVAVDISHLRRGIYFYRATLAYADGGSERLNGGRFAILR